MPRRDRGVTRAKCGYLVTQVTRTFAGGDGQYLAESAVEPAMHKQVS
jgi:hypothetical protein